MNQMNVEEGPLLFVGGLPQTVRDDDLKLYCEQNFGSVKRASVKMDNISNRSRGFGFVQFMDQQSCDMMIYADSSQLIIHDKQVEVKAFDQGAKPSPEAREREAQRNLPKEHNSCKSVAVFSSPPTPEELSCFVGGLPQTVDDAMLSQYCSQFGEVESAEVKMDPVTQRSKGFGFVKFADSEGVSGICRNYDDNMLENKWIEVTQRLEKRPARIGGKESGGKGGYVREQRSHPYSGGQVSSKGGNQKGKGNAYGPARGGGKDFGKQGFHSKGKGGFSGKDGGKGPFNAGKGRKY